MAGIYIKGMETQRDGTYRMGLVVKEGKITVGLVKEESFANKDIEWFSCVLVPDHGDLVDIDDVLKDFAELRDYDFALRKYVIIPADKEEM